MTDINQLARASDAADDWGRVAVAWEANRDDIERPTAAAVDALVDAVTLQPGDRVLELACGPGTLGRRLAETTGPSGSVVLSDLAPEMVEVARRHTLDLPHVSATVIDAAAIDCPDQSFDVVVSQMGLMFCPDPPAAFAEIHRVLDEGGRFGALVWGALEHNPWMTCIGMAAMANGLVAGGPPTGAGGIFSLSDPAMLVTLVGDAGFADVAVDEWPVLFTADSIDAHIDRVTAVAGPLASVLREASPEQLRAVRTTATELASVHTDTHGPIELPGLALLVSGRR
jgi:SAM-dependent methyltransferase